MAILLLPWSCAKSLLYKTVKVYFERNLSEITTDYLSAMFARYFYTWTFLKTAKDNHKMYLLIKEQLKFKIMKTMCWGDI